MNQYTYLLMWQYCKDLNDINTAIMEKDENWEGLTRAEQIISVSWDGTQNAYLVTWRVRRWLNGGPET